MGVWCKKEKGGHFFKFILQLLKKQSSSNKVKTFLLHFYFKFIFLLSGVGSAGYSKLGAWGKILIRSSQKITQQEFDLRFYKVIVKVPNIEKNQFKHLTWNELNPFFTCKNHERTWTWFKFIITKNKQSTRVFKSIHNSPFIFVGFNFQ